MIITRYTLAQQQEWDNFITASKNGTFLMKRNYMDYHADRFNDHSLMIRADNGKLLALLPAHLQDTTLASHNGLTYGGLISTAEMTTPLMLEVFDALLAYCRAESFSKLLYKTIPHIYHRMPAEEDRYSLFRHEARLYRRDVLSVIDMNERVPYQERRTRKIKLARKSAIETVKTHDVAAFWQVLEDNLMQRYAVKPVHSLAEITLLIERFPKEIELHAAFLEGRMLAGVVLYRTPQTLHVQYISASEEGKKLGALDLVFSELLDTIANEHRYFDFGISTEDSGMQLNTGLIEQKEGFGGRAIVHDMYEIKLS